ncbi:hypothetical protein B296_00042571 [Ensete ventricosum]|uniref:Uncharacterized protein n=1 Tax=Ensete ventricosum TaxID=4639 RepID=A0A426ZHY3_ENSVE|nr:hypothetical protein B296_00042571 [Ensete ventricosum]
MAIVGGRHGRKAALEEKGRWWSATGAGDRGGLGCGRGDCNRGKKRQRGPSSEGYDSRRAARSGKGCGGGRHHRGVQQRSTRLGAMGATSASSERRKGQQGSELAGGEEATTDGRGEDSDGRWEEDAAAGGCGEDNNDRWEEAEGNSAFGAATSVEAGDSSREARGHHRQPPLLAIALAIDDYPLRPGHPYKRPGHGHSPCQRPWPHVAALARALAIVGSPYRWPSHGWPPLQAAYPQVAALLLATFTVNYNGKA